MAKEKKAKQPRKTQEHLPQMAPEKIPAVHNAALKYDTARAEHVAAKKEKDACELRLRDAMEKQGITRYTYGDIDVQIESKTSVKVKIKSAEPPATDGDEGDD